MTHDQAKCIVKDFSCGINNVQIILKSNDFSKDQFIEF